MKLNKKFLLSSAILSAVVLSPFAIFAEDAVTTSVTPIVTTVETTAVVEPLTLSTYKAKMEALRAERKAKLQAIEKEYKANTEALRKEWKAVEIKARAEKKIAAEKLRAEAKAKRDEARAKKVAPATTTPATSDTTSSVTQ